MKNGRDRELAAAALAELRRQALNLGGAYLPALEGKDAKPKIGPEIEAIMDELLKPAYERLKAEK